MEIIPVDNQAATYVVLISSFRTSPFSVIMLSVSLLICWLKSSSGFVCSL